METKLPFILKANQVIQELSLINNFKWKSIVGRRNIHNFEQKANTDLEGNPESRSTIFLKNLEAILRIFKF
jgi:hypothetical protein